MKRALILLAIFATGLLFALATLSSSARAGGVSCSTDAAAEVAAATVTDLGNGWSQPGQGDLWDVNMSDIAYDVSVYAQDASGARVAAQTALTQQIGTLGCTTTTATTQGATASVATTTVTLPASTQYVTTTVSSVVPLLIPSPAQTVTTASTVTTTTKAQTTPINVTVNVGGAKVCGVKTAAKKPKTKR